MKRPLENIIIYFGFIIVFCAVHWISHHVVPKRQKKSREFPLGGPSPCGKTGLAPCRQCTFPSCLFPYCFPAIWPYSHESYTFGVLHELLVHDRSPPKKRKYIFANSSAQRAKYQSESGNHQESVQSSAHKRLVSQKSGTNSQNVLGKNSRELCLQVRLWVWAAPTTNNTKYCIRHL